MCSHSNSNIFNRLLTACFALILGAAAFAQSATVAVTVIPPYTKTYTDYLAAGKINATIKLGVNVVYDDIATSPYPETCVARVYLQAKLTCVEKGITIQTRPDAVPYAPIKINGRRIIGADGICNYDLYTVTHANIRSMLAPDKVSYTGITAQQLQQNGLPDGNYQLTIIVYHGFSATAPFDQEYGRGTANFTLQSVQPVVNQTVQVLPPYTKILSDYASGTKINSVIQVTQHPDNTANLTVYGGIFSTDGSIRIDTNSDFGTPAEVTITKTGSAFPPYVLTNADLRKIFNPQTMYYSGITKEQVARDGLPPGTYTVCFEVTSLYQQSSYDLGRFCSAPFTIQDVPPIVNQTVQVLAPYTNVLNDYFSGTKLLSVVTVSQFPADEARLRVRGILRSVDGSLRIGGRLAQNTPLHPISINKNGTVWPPKTLTAADYAAIFDPQKLEYSGITQEQVARDGLPAGTYEICFELYDADQTKLLSSACSAPFTIAAVPAVVNMTVQALPPYTSRLEDYFSATKLVSTLTVSQYPTSRAEFLLSAQLHRIDGGIMIQGSENAADVVLTKTGGVFPAYTLTQTDIANLFKNLTFSGISKEEVRQNGLPAGTYAICIKVKSLQGNDASETGTFCSAPFLIAGAVPVIPQTGQDLEPPIIIQPVDSVHTIPGSASPVQFSWTIPAGAPGTIRYRLKIIELTSPGMNYRDMLRSDSYPAFFETTVNAVPTYLYTAANPAFRTDRTYAFVVQARNAAGTAPVKFRNDGYSEPAVFRLKERSSPIGDLIINNDTVKDQLVVQPAGGLSDIFPDQPQIPMMLSNPQVKCDCTTAPDGSGDLTQLNPGDKVTVGGNFLMTVTSVQKEGDAFRGEGTIPLTMISGRLKLRVRFYGLKAYGNNRMYAGVVKARISSRFDFLPTADAPDIPAVTLDSENIKSIDAHLKRTKSQLLSNIQQAGESIGYELPVGLDKGPVTIAVNEMYFNAEQAWFNASAAMALAAEGKTLTLAGHGFCVTGSGFCKEGLLGLAKDFEVTEQFVLKAPAGTDPGTHIQFDGKGFKTLAIKADYTFDKLIKVKDKQKAVATLTATTDKGWSDWIAQVSLEPFHIEGIPDFEFSVPQGRPVVYDHSTTKNVQGMPASLQFSEQQTLSFEAGWTGFYLPELSMTLPEGINKLSNGTSVRTQVGVQHFVYDEQGLSGKIGARNVLGINDGSLDGWYFSIDVLTMNFFRSSLAGAEMCGKLQLPVSGKREGNNLDRKEIGYTCNLSYDNAKLQYCMAARPNRDLDFSAWAAKAVVEESSSVTVSNASGNFEAIACLNGGLELNASPQGLPDLTLAHVKFTNLRISSQSGLQPGSLFEAGLGSADNGDHAQATDPATQEVLYACNPPHGPNPDPTEAGQSLGGKSPEGSLMGFNFTLHAIEPYFKDSNIGLQFGSRMQLVNGVDFIPRADLLFALYAKPNERDGRKWWQSAGGKILDARLEADADLAGMKLKGSIRYFDFGGQYQDRGFGGKLEVMLPAATGGAGLTMKGLFGSRKVGGKYFQYFFVDGAVDLGTGIPLFAGVNLYGFAGGAYYNMKQDATKTRTPYGESPQTDKIPLNSMESFSGAVYTPISHQGTSLGFLAGVYVGLSARQILEVEASLHIGFVNGSLNQIDLKGRGAFVNEGGSNFNDKFNKALGQAKAAIEVQLENGEFKHFNAGFGANLAYPRNHAFVKADASMQFYMDNENHWFIKIGTPARRAGVEYDFIVFKQRIGSYFECGNYKIDVLNPEEAIPAWIRQLASGRGGDSENYFSNQADADNSPKASRDPKKTSKTVIIGSTLEYSWRAEFLIFYAFLRAGFGFDLSLEFAEQAICSNGSSKWYALGDAYMGAAAKCGVHVGVFGMDRDIDFLSAGVGAIVKAGLPDPAFFSGRIGGHFSVLGGLISKNFSIRFDVGTKCRLDNTNQEHIELISELLPENGQKDVDFASRPAVVFNFPIDRPFIVPLDRQTKDGDFFTDYTVFRIPSEDVKISLTTPDSQDRNFLESHFKISKNTVSPEPAYTMELNSREPLAIRSRYTFSVSAKVKKYPVSFTMKHFADAVLHNATSGGYVYVMDGKKPYVNRKEVSFTTGKGFETLPEKYISRMAPYPRTRAVPTKQYSQGFIELGMDRKYGMDDFNFSDGKKSVSAWVRIINLTQLKTTEVRANWSSSLISFGLPLLEPNCLYVMQLLLRDDGIAALEAGNVVKDLSTRLVTQRKIQLDESWTGLKKGNGLLNTNLLNPAVSDNYTAVNARKLVGLKALDIKQGYHQLYSWYFQTGNAGHYLEKTRRMVLQKIEYELKTGAKTIDVRAPKEVNLHAAEWGPDERTKTINPLAFKYFYRTAPGDHPFNAGDFMTYRGDYLTEPYDRNEHIWWEKNCRIFEEKSPVFQHQMRSVFKKFVENAFGPDKVLQFDSEWADGEYFISHLSAPDNNQAAWIQDGPEYTWDLPSMTSLLPAGLSKQELNAIGASLVPASPASPATGKASHLTRSKTKVPLATQLSSTLDSFFPYDAVYIKELSTEYGGAGQSLGGTLEAIVSKMRGDWIINWGNNMNPVDAISDRTDNMGLDNTISAMGAAMDQIQGLSNILNNAVSLPEGFAGPTLNIGR